MKKKSLIVSGTIGTIVGLFFLMTAVVVPSVNTSNNCVDIDCLKDKLRLICETDPKPEYLDCENILRCMDKGEQEVIRCARAYQAIEELVSGPGPNNRNNSLNFTNGTSIDQEMCNLGIKSSCPCDPPDYYGGNKTGSYRSLRSWPLPALIQIGIVVKVSFLHRTLCTYRNQ